MVRKLVNLTCKQCRVVFPVKIYLVHKRVFCSRTCKDKSLVGKPSPCIGQKRPQMEGSKNPYWGGNKVGYGGIHQWLSKNFGQPKYCEFCLRGAAESKRYEWALKKGLTYERKKENFIRLCKKCHNDYDGVNAYQQRRNYAS